MAYNFFATISRMKYIERWALMRSSRPENISEHSLEVAMIAHALCTIGNVRYGKHLSAERAAVIGLYHDATEIITGDMPTPVKYFNPEIRSAYREVETMARQRLLEGLPEDLKPSYEAVFQSREEEADRELRELVKAADKLSALIKCMEEENAGNGEFRTAKQTIFTAVKEMAQTHPEVRDFIRDFMEPYGNTLDELL
ncbi:MAG: 5'-deoxynucleotidase [Lachnospiraceae bacterium]|nr:5'-deoxynucleotidase [Lachnospiraceae bacterium]MCI1657549.1 5'-deoxynucleotidase [Lachnospiraceae bacterium]MCI2195964.1 5'-deoxynucleotidase [Lachnospiraceae bacterium]